MQRRTAGKVSAQAQRFILETVYDYERWTDVSLVQASRLLGMPKITASLVFDELAAIDPRWIVVIDGIRWFHQEANRKQFLTRAAPHLFNPVIREYRLSHSPAYHHLSLSGLSAICHHAELADNPYPTFAITREQEGELGLREGKGIVEWDQWNAPACAVQVMRYALDSMNEQAIDPLSAILSLSDEESEDPRIGEGTASILKQVLEGESWALGPTKRNEGDPRGKGF